MSMGEHVFVPDGNVVSRRILSVPDGNFIYVDRIEIIVVPDGNFILMG
jgi:hypothetical protein